MKGEAVKGRSHSIIGVRASLPAYFDAFPQAPHNYAAFFYLEVRYISYVVKETGARLDLYSVCTGCAAAVHVCAP